MRSCTSSAGSGMRSSRCGGVGQGFGHVCGQGFGCVVHTRQATTVQVNLQGGRQVQQGVELVQDQVIAGG